MIDTKLLRQKILDLAIRGKLVPQNPTDEPASELLKKIKAEKDALVKAGKIKKDKHESFIFRGDDKRYYEQIDGKTIDITEEIPFDIPDSWCWCRLRILASTALGKMLDKHKNHGIPMPYLRNVNVRWGIFDLSELLQMRFEPSETERYSIKTGDLVVCEGGEPGRCAVWTNALKDIRIQKALHRVRPYNGISSLLLSYIFRRYAQIQYIDKFFTGSTIKHLTGEALNQLLIILPPVAEQQRIVSQIKALLKYVDEIDRESETLEKFITLAKQKILDLAIKGKLVPQDPSDEPASELLKKIKAEKDALIKTGKIKRDKHESFIFRGDDNCYHENIDGKVTDVTEDIPFDLPDEWEWCRLSTISEFDLGKTLDRQKNTGNYRKYLRSVNVLWGNIDLSDVKEMRFEDTELERYSIKKGDLLICEGGDVGRCAVWNKDFVFYYQNALHRVRFYQKCIPLFYQFVMMFFENTGLLKKISQGVTIKHLTKNTLNSMFFPLPPLAEQKRIVSQVEKLFAVLETMLG